MFKSAKTQRKVWWYEVRDNLNAQRLIKFIIKLDQDLFKDSLLPLARIKKIMKSDEDVGVSLKK